MTLSLCTPRCLAFAAVGAVLAGAAGWPVQTDSREQLFEIPPGTWARRHAGIDQEILPSNIDLVLGLKDILVLKNRDSVPQTFGPTLIMPGQTFRLPFSVASEYQFACTAHLSGQMTVRVAEGPTSPWARLRFRAGAVGSALASWLRE